MHGEKSVGVSGKPTVIGVSMTTLEMAFIAVGLSMDIFAWVACKGTSFSNIGRKKLLLFVAAFGVWEMISISLGFYVAWVLEVTRLSSSADGLLKLIALAIFFALAIRMLLLAMGKEVVEEHRQDEIKFFPLLKDTSVIAVRTFLAGLAVSLCNTGVVVQYVMLILIGTLTVILGLYAGYEYGFQVKTKAYLAGFVSLLLADILFLIRQFRIF